MDQITKQETLEGFEAVMNCLKQCLAYMLVHGEYKKAMAIQFFYQGVYQEYVALQSEY